MGGAALFMIAKCDISSKEGLGSAAEAVKVFNELGFKRAQAVALHAVANGCLLQKVGPKEAMSAAKEALALYKAEADKQGEAIMLHTVANCQIALKEVDQAVSSAYEALHLFEELGDTYGKSLALKLLKGAGQSQAEIHEQQAQQLARFDGLGTKDTSISLEEKKKPR